MVLCLLQKTCVKLEIQITSLPISIPVRNRSNDHLYDRQIHTMITHEHLLYRLSRRAWCLLQRKSLTNSTNTLTVLEDLDVNSLFTEDMQQLGVPIEYAIILHQRMFHTILEKKSSSAWQVSILRRLAIHQEFSQLNYRRQRERYLVYSYFIGS